MRAREEKRRQGQAGEGGERKQEKLVMIEFDSKMKDK